jgi:hypothetical protein
MEMILHIFRCDEFKPVLFLAHFYGLYEEFSAMDAVEEIAFVDAQRPAMMCGTLFSLSCGSRHISPP